jgi:hypothetical protein
MWPTHVQGPRALTLVETFNVSSVSNGSYTTTICIFGEHHDTSQCNDKAMDVIKDKDGDYVLDDNGSNPHKWTIGRLLYVLAKSTESQLEYFFEIRFKREKTIRKEAVNLFKLAELFQECLQSSKEKCKFLPNVYMHAIDYRSEFGLYLLNGETPAAYKLFASLIFTQDYYTGRIIYAGNSYSTFMEYMSHYYLENHDVGYTFTPLFFWDRLSLLTNKSLGILSEIGKEGKGKVSSLVVEFLESLYGAKFKVIDILLIYLSSENDHYLRYIRKVVAISSTYLLKFEELLTNFEFKTAQIFIFMFNITIWISQFNITCKRILEGKHHSVKRNHKGIIVSRASLQIRKIANVQFGKKRLVNLLSEWISLKGEELISGLLWKDWFVSSFQGTQTYDKYNTFLGSMINDHSYFMDVSAIARMFLHNSPLKICYMGDAHRDRIRSFFEHCRLNTNTVIAKENACLLLPQEMIDKLPVPK